MCLWIDILLKQTEYFCCHLFPIEIETISQLTFPNSNDFLLFRIIIIGRKMIRIERLSRAICRSDFCNVEQNITLKMGDYLPEEYTAYSLLVSYGTMTSGNGKIPMKGSLAMSLRIASRFKEMGGVLHTSASVSEIVIDRKKASGIGLSDGSLIKADYVISAVDTDFLFGKLIDRQYMPADLARAYENRRAYPVTTGFQAAYAIDDDFSEKDTIIFDCEPLKVGQRSFDRISVKNYSYDDSFAPAGKAVLQANLCQSDEDYLFWESLNPEEYKTTKQNLTEEVTERIVKEFPELAGKINVLDSWTPLTYNRYCNAYHGSYMGFVTTVGNKQMIFEGRL